MRLPDLPFITRTRRHHALEHATIHLLNQRYPSQRLVGWSTPNAFFVYGHVPTAAVQRAAHEALARLTNGEHHLAVHPRCGTNLVVGSLFVGLIAYLAMLPGDDRSRQSRLPLVILVSTFALMLSQPLGLAVQEHITTDAHPPAGAAVQVTSGTAGTTPVHKVQLT